MKKSSAKKPKLNVTLVNQSKDTLPRTFLKNWVAEMSAQIFKETGRFDFDKKELVVVFLSEREAKNLNKKFRGRDYATDVLSFSADEDDDLVGELVICPKVIKRQAKEHGLLVKEELGYMVLHGFLHLLGYDHEGSKAKAKKMFQIQDLLFKKLLDKA